jgi:hypothetical protein
MRVEVKLASGQIIYPSYEPAQGRLEQLIKFYQERYHTYQIEAYRIINNANVTVAAEGTF